MNMTKDLITRIENRRQETKVPCKNYATEEAAEKAIQKMARIVADHHEVAEPADYLVVYNEAWGRWVAAINLSELLRRPGRCGGYLGLCAQADFYSF